MVVSLGAIASGESTQSRESAKAGRVVRLEDIDWDSTLKSSDRTPPHFPSYDQREDLLGDFRMLDIDKQYIFNEQGEAIAVQIPLNQFQQIESLLNRSSQELIDAEQVRKNQAAIDLLDSWLGEDEDASEHEQAWEFLKTALDEDRLSNRPLFP